MRKKAVSYMRSHKDDFLPFLTNDEGDMMSDGRAYAWRTIAAGVQQRLSPPLTDFYNTTSF